jgi:tetratricopeptide (TPR) repeat protein
MRDKRLKSPRQQAPLPPDPQVVLSSGNPEAALARALRDVQVHPTSLDAWLAATRALSHAGRSTEAAQAAETAVRLTPGERTFRIWAATLRNDQRPAAAAAALAQALARYPCRVETSREHAEAVRATRDLTAAAGAWDAHLQRFPEDGVGHHRRARLAEDAFDGARALQHWRRAAALLPKDPEVLCGLAAREEMANHLEAAEEALAAAQRGGALTLSGRVTRARVLRRRGRPAEALAQLDETLSASGAAPPGQEAAWWAQRARAQSERGLCLDALGRPVEAFAAFVEKGHSTLQSPDLARATARWIERTGAAAGATSALLERARQPFPAVGPDPVFVVGFPRSGTTLVEQILGAHPALHATDETPVADSLAQVLGGVFPGASPYPQGLLERRDDPELGPKLREAWFTVQEQLSPGLPRDRRLIDKMPFNLFHLGMLNLAFPAAPVVMLLRDPRDTALSCLMQPFAANGAMGALQTMDDIVATQERYYELWRAARAELVQPWRELRYEELVDDPSGHAGALLQWLGLPWDPAVARWWDQARERVIRTASYAQVAQPIYTHARARWRRYEEPLRPWRARLDALAERLGYAT